MPRPSSTLQHFSLITQSSSAICDSAILIETSLRDDTSLWFYYRYIIIDILKINSAL